VSAFSEEEVTRFYKKVEVSTEEVLCVSYKSVTEPDYLLIETNDLKEGMYEVTVTRIDSHIYKIDGTDIFIKMPYCYEYCYSEDAYLKIKKYGSKLTGTLIWE